MSQPLGSPIRFEGDQPKQTEVGIYQGLMAKGHFRPLTSTTLPSARENAAGPDPAAHVPSQTGTAKAAYPQATSLAPIAHRRAAYSPSPAVTPDCSPPPTPTPITATGSAYPPHQATVPLEYHSPRATTSSSNPPYPPHLPHAPPPEATYNAYVPTTNSTYVNTYGSPTGATYSNTYAPPVNPTYTAYGSHSTMPRLPTSNIDPNLLSHEAYNPAAYAPVQPPIYTPDSITYEMIATRIQYLLQGKLTCPVSVIATLSSTITNHLVSLGMAGKLGACGLEKVNDIFMVVGREGAMSYMALAVIAPVELRVLLKGPNTDLEGKDALKDPQAMEWLRQGFHNVALSEWEIIVARTKGMRR